MNSPAIQSITDHLLADRALISLSAARHNLATRARIRTPLGASEFLTCRKLICRNRETYDKRIQVALDCMDIYRTFFPEAYALSASPYFSTQREHELYRLIQANCFPLLFSQDVDIETHIRNEPNFFLPFIPIRGTQAHMWVPGSFNIESLEIEYQLVWALNGYFDAGGTGWQAMKIMYGLEGIPEPGPVLGNIGWQLFYYSCTVEDTPIKYINETFRMTSYKTGNAWLDLPPLGFIGNPWTKEEVARLTLMRTQADDIRLAVKAFGLWLEESPTAHIGRVVELWNRAGVTEAEYGYAGMGTDDLVREHGARRVGHVQYGDDLVHLTIPGGMFGEMLREWPEEGEDL